jgi:hypothetical protein
MRGIKRLPAYVLGIGFVGLILAVVYRYDPARVHIYPTCMFYYYTGLCCPGCGGTRAMHQLLHGNIKAALHYNFLIVIILPLLGYSFIAEMFRPGNTRLRKLFSKPAVAYCVLGLLLVFGIVRNLPWYPFTLLYP